MFTSLKLSKLLQENGFEGESETCGLFVPHHNYKGTIINKYDILNDLCVKYAKEMFGEDFDPICKRCGTRSTYSAEVLSLLQQNKQEEAEDYIIKNCILFK